MFDLLQWYVKAESGPCADTAMQAAARIAADCSNRSLRNVRAALCNVEADTADKFAQGQQQVCICLRAAPSTAGSLRY